MKYENLRNNLSHDRSFKNYEISSVQIKDYHFISK